MDEDVAQLIREDLGILFGLEVAARTAPRDQGRRHSADQLTHTRFAPIGAQLSTKVLASDYVRRSL